ncbi:uncharacterized protein ARMOST_17735 [Armillaria ostoyae]|uniref:Uncharacterized protein n=1 Tax=Armillaria ostoyae TaxID=47428 RepID=A0A284RZT8_ARMOS|nr:uncharacterized protein ARMOST_17735 [Armillaria ostoyae]
MSLLGCEKGETFGEYELRAAPRRNSSAANDYKEGLFVGNLSLSSESTRRYHCDRYRDPKFAVGFNTGDGMVDYERDVATLTYGYSLCPGMA